MHLSRCFISYTHVQTIIVVKMNVSVNYITGMVDVIEVALTINALCFVAIVYNIPFIVK